MPIIIEHLNIPQQSTPSTGRQAFRRSIQRFSPKLGWILFNLAAPEWPLGKAWANLEPVKSMEEKIAALAKEDETPWSRAHSNFANMGGFVIKFGTKSDLTTGPSPESNRDDPDPSKPTPEPTSINLPHIHPNNNPSTSRRSDTVVDTEQHPTAVGQIGWFVIQLCVRLAARLATSQLEILTLAYALCAAVTYYLLRDTPKNCQFSMMSIALAGLMPFIFPFRGSVWIPNSYVHAEHTAPRRGIHLSITLGGIFAVVLLGCVHCIAWNFASFIIAAAAIPVGLLLRKVQGSLFRSQRELSTSFSSRFFNLSTGSLILIFFASRIFVVVEALRSLGFLPPSAYATTWSANIPHIG
ncbi:hypothetical protein B0H14DRAFT_3111547 [Mycena olivaceomarginata]|nr:hypothetical protein B0H14DRAFT_3111547 [Mycena olivaceomarginata]